MRRNTRLVTVGGARLAVGLALVACAILVPATPRMVTSGRALNLTARVAKSVAARPLSFEPNQGQASSEVLFLARLKDSSLLLTRDGITLPLTTPRVASAQPPSVQMQFIGANPAPEVFGAARLSGTSNYFIGRDPSAWHTNIPTYGEVTYRQLYPGIDATLHGIGGHLEYDFIVHPGADPHTIGLHFSGATGLQIGPAGELVIDTAAGQLRQSPPHLYQGAGDSQHLVSGRFDIRGEDEVGFAVGSYDPGHPLIIDPVLAYSTYLGGSAYDAGVSIALDATGNIYIAGDTKSLDFPAVNAYQQNYAGGPFDAVVTKLNPSGSAILYSTYLGGVSYDRANGIVVDANGDAFVAGRADSRNFPVVNPIQATSGGGPDAFVSEFSPSGSSLLFSTYLGGTAFDRANAIALGPGGVVWVTGRTHSTNFPTVNPIQAANAGGPFDAWVAKIDPTTPLLLFSTYLGGAKFDGGNGIAVDDSGNAYATGRTSSSNFPTVNPIQAYAGSIDIWVAKFAPDGSALLYSTFIGGKYDDRGVDIAVDSSGAVYVTGRTDSPDFPVRHVGPGKSGQAPAARPAANFNLFDAFALELNPAGSALVYSLRLGGSLHEDGEGIAVDASGNAYFVGATFSTDFPVLNAVQPTFGGGISDAFAAEVDPTGSLVYATYLGGSDQDMATSVDLNGSGGAFIAGFTASTNFPTVNPVQAQNAGNVDVFVSEISG